MTLELRAIQTLIPRSVHVPITPYSPSLGILPDVDGRVEGRLGRLLHGGIDRRQSGLRTRDLTGGSDLFSFVAHGESALLVRQEALEIERARP